MGDVLSLSRSVYYGMFDLQLTLCIQSIVTSERLWVFMQQGGDSDWLIFNVNRDWLKLVMMMWQSLISYKIVYCDVA